MANVNINRNIEDQFYRYKMPRIIAKVEGKGNGIKTVIVNMSDVAKSLQRPPTYPCKYFGCELGAQTQFDLKNDRYIVNGAHEGTKLQDLLDGFIKKFVLCSECENPETNLVVSTKKGNIVARCIACGHTGNIDMRHKLTTYILKNPPDQDSSQTPNKKDKKGRRGGKGNDDAKPEPNGDSMAGDVPLSISSQIESENKDEIDDDDWGDDTTEEAVKQRMLQLTDAAQNLAFTDDLEKTPQERVDIFYNFVKRKKNSESIVGSEREIVAEAERLDVKDKGPLVLCELLYDQNIVTQIKKYRTLFLRFTVENPKAQKYLLGGFEQLVGNVYQSTLLPKAPHILKAFYDNDILTEEQILEWSKKVSKKYVDKKVSEEIHEKALPFIKWLEEAEEESSEEEEEEIEVVYSHTEKVGTSISKPSGNTAAVEEDDSYIDDI